MKEQLALMLGVGAIITLLIIAFFDLITYKAKLNKYEEYYKCSERLLDHLESNLNWMNRFDDPAVNEYYNARENLLKQLRK